MRGVSDQVHPVGSAAPHDQLTADAWCAASLVPVGWAAALALAVGGGTTGVRAMLAGLVAIAAPVLAVVLADRAACAHERAGPVRTVSGALLFVSLVALPGTLVAGAWFVHTLALGLVALVWAVRTTRRWSASE